MKDEALELGLLGRHPEAPRLHQRREGYPMRHTTAKIQ
jgi:hypothetical protein